MVAKSTYRYYSSTLNDEFLELSCSVRDLITLKIIIKEVFENLVMGSEKIDFCKDLLFMSKMMVL